MKKQVVILADRNYEQYLMMLQLKFVEEKSDEVELVVITDQAYYQEYFSMPRSAGVLIVDSRLVRAGHPSPHAGARVRARREELQERPGGVYQ